jgi:hypothetical protein
MSKNIYLKAKVKGGEFELFTFFFNPKFWLFGWWIPSLIKFLINQPLIWSHIIYLFLVDFINLFTTSFINLIYFITY